jgi:D-alanine-D-alanine ligase
MRNLRVLVLVDEDLLPPDSIEDFTDEEVAPWKTEYDVIVSLKELGHEVRPLGVRDDLGVIGAALKSFKPHIVFNLIEEFGGLGTCVPYVLGYLELVNQAYTGCNPRGLVLSDNKVLMKKLLRYHRIPVPDFAVFPRQKAVRRPPRLAFPLIVKTAAEHGSMGIAQASVVYDDDKLQERVAFVHEQQNTDALAESYIDGRELYVGVMGNHRLLTFPIWEMVFEKLADGSLPIATDKVKWDLRYQKRRGIKTQAAEGLSDEMQQRIWRLCRRAFRVLGQTGYARLDLRLTPEGKLHVLESNPNPNLAFGEDFTESAESSGIEYGQLIQRILNLGLRYHAQHRR